MAVRELSPLQLSEWLADEARARPIMLDVREPWEFQLCCIAGSLHCPMGTVPARAAELDADAAMVLICHHGQRSLQAALYLERAGFSNLYNLAGGVDAWGKIVEPSMSLY